VNKVINYKKKRNKYSQMVFSNNENHQDRKTIDEIIKKWGIEDFSRLISGELDELFGLSEMKEDLARIGITRLPSIDVVDEYDNYPRNHCCFSYVFRTVLGYDEETLRRFHLWTETAESLLSLGFVEIEEPRNEDIVCYRREDGEYYIAHHFGIFDDRRVISKWGIGSVFRHDLFQVPSIYGNHVLFFGKQD
jgi:hypothetical protein